MQSLKALLTNKKRFKLGGQLTEVELVTVSHASISFKGQ
jgi:hypothetical protein